MENPQPPSPASPATYEIRFQGTLPETLSLDLPSATICTTRAETVLFRHIESATELDSLLDQLMSMGLVLTEIHEVPLTDTATDGQDDAQGSEVLRDDEGV